MEQAQPQGVQAPPQQQEPCKQQVPHDWPHMIPAPGQALLLQQQQQQQQEQGLPPSLQPHRKPSMDQDADIYIQDLMAIKTPANKQVRHTCAAISSPLCNYMHNMISLPQAGDSVHIKSCMVSTSLTALHNDDEIQPDRLLE